MTGVIALEFEDSPSTDTPIDATNLNEMQTSLLDLVFPIGRGFIDFTNTDYSNYLGFTWERELVGMTPVGLDTSQTEFNTIGKTGGSKTHTLTKTQLPKIDIQTKYASSIGGDGSGLVFGTSIGNSTNGFVYNENYGGQAHNNLQPYKVVSFWKRVA